MPLGSFIQTRDFNNGLKLCEYNQPANPLALIKPSEEILILFRTILEDTYKETVKDVAAMQKSTDKQITDIERNQLVLVERFVEGKVEVDEEYYKKLLDKNTATLKDL